MQKESIIYGIVGLLVGSVLTVAITSNISKGRSAGVKPMMGALGDNQQVTNSSLIDAHFIEQMIPHHEDAITMAKLALERSERDEIRSLSQNIIDGQSREIDEMKSWYKDWFGRELPENASVMSGHGMMSGSSMHMGMMGTNMDLSKLQNATDFDKVFIEDMIPHHQMAVMMANMLKVSTTRAEMQKLAEDIIVAQTKEIDQMRLWYQKWGY